MTRQSWFFSFAMTLALLSGPVQAQDVTKSVDSPSKQQCGSCCDTPILSKLPILNVLFKAKKHVTKQATPISKGKNIACPDCKLILKNQPQLPPAQWRPTSKVSTRSFVIIKKADKNEKKCGCAKKCICAEKAKCARCKDSCKCCKCEKEVNSCPFDVNVNTPAQQCCPLASCPIIRQGMPVHVRQLIKACPVKNVNPFTASQFVINVHVQELHPTTTKHTKFTVTTMVGRPANLQIGDKRFTIQVHPKPIAQPVRVPSRVIYRQAVPVYYQRQPMPQTAFPAPVHPWFVPHPAHVHMVPPTAALPHPVPHPQPVMPPMPVAAPCCPMEVNSSLCCHGAGKFFSMLTELLEMCANVYTLNELSQKDYVQSTMTLPTPHYLEHPPRFYPAAPEESFTQDFAALQEVGNPLGGDELEESYHWNNAQVTPTDSISSKVAHVQISDCGKLNIKVTEGGVLITGRGVKCRAKKMTVDGEGAMRLDGQVQIQCEKESCEMSFYADHVWFRLNGPDLKVEMRDVKFVK